MNDESEEFIIHHSSFLIHESYWHEEELQLDEKFYRIDLRKPVGDEIHHGMMWQGKKSTAEAIFYAAMERLGEKTGEEPRRSLRKRSIRSLRRLRSNRVGIGGATYQVPLEVTKDRRNTLASAGSSETHATAAKKRWSTSGR